MSIRFERTPLILALVLAVAAIAMPFLVSVNLAFVFGGAALLMVAVSLFAGNRNADRDNDDDEEVAVVETATVTFGPDATEPPRKMTAKEKKATKKAQRDAKKAAAQREKFEKKAQADAAKASKKAAKGGGKGGEFDDFWVDTLKEMNTQKDDPTPLGAEPVAQPVPVTAPPVEPVFPGFASPFGEAVETVEEVTATAEPTYEPAAPVVEERATVYRADTEEIPIIPAAPIVEEAAPEPETSENDWVFDTYNDPNFTPPYTSNITLANNKVGTRENDDDILDFEDADDPLSALPAEVDFVYKDDDVSSPAGRLKALADRFQSLAADINHDWEDLMQAYEQRDALVRALKEALGENERLKKEMLQKSMETKEIDSVSERLEEAKAEVARLYEDTRELSRLKYLNSQTSTRLKELRFAIASQPTPDTALLALVDQAIAESE